MRFLRTISILAAGFASVAQAFTNGTLLPAYLCANAGDGYPKSAGTLIPYLQLGTAADAYNQFPGGNGTVKIQFAAGTDPNGNAIAPTARQIVGAFHNGQPPMYENSVKNPVWMGPMGIDINTAAGSYVITPGQLHHFIIAVNCPTGLGGFNAKGMALDGFFAYAVDTATNQRIGSWVNVGPTFSSWYACNPQGTASTSVGIVHNSLVSGDSSIANLSWQAPAQIQGLVKFIGAGVADCGFGPMTVIFNTTTNTGAPSIAAQGLIANEMNDGQAFVLAGAAPNLVQTIPTPQSTTPTVTAGAAAGIGIGGAVIGGIAVGVAMYFVGRKPRGADLLL